jgi:hypothetical protein
MDYNELRYIFDAYLHAGYNTQLILNTISKVLFNQISDPYSSILRFNPKSDSAVILLTNNSSDSDIIIPNRPSNSNFPYWTFMIPEIPKLSQNIVKFVRSNIPLLSTNLTPRIIQIPFNNFRRLSTNKLSMTCTEDLKQSGLVYAIRCKDCISNGIISDSPAIKIPGLIYIGETLQTLKARLRGHMSSRSNNSPVLHHYLVNKHENLEVAIIAKENSTPLRKIIESFFIRALKPLCNRDDGVILNFTVPTVWLHIDEESWTPFC